MPPEQLETLIEQIRIKLEVREIPLELVRRKPVSPAVVAEAEAALHRSLPLDLKSFYTTFSDGLDVYWRSAHAFARFSLPPLTTFLRDYFKFQAEVNEQYLSPSEYFNAADIVLAETTLRSMRDWAVLWDTSGYSVCINLESGAIIYHDKEWQFYQTLENGFLIADNLMELLIDWGAVGFAYFSGGPGVPNEHYQHSKPTYPAFDELLQ